MTPISPRDLQELKDTALEAGARLANVCDRLAIALEVPRGEIDRAVEEAVSAGRRLREAIWWAAEAVTKERPSWADEDALRQVVVTLSEGLEKLAREGDCGRLQALATELRTGVITDDRPVRRDRAEKQRASALREIEGALDSGPPCLPWPATPVESVILWLAAASPAVHQAVGEVLPALAEFLVFVDAAWWQPGAAAAPAPGVVDGEVPVTNPSVGEARAQGESPSSVRAVPRGAVALGLLAGSPGDRAGDGRPVPTPRTRFVASPALTGALGLGEGAPRPIVAHDRPFERPASLLRGDVPLAVPTQLPAAVSLLVASASAQALPVPAEPPVLPAAPPATPKSPAGPPIVPDLPAGATNEEADEGPFNGAEIAAPRDSTSRTSEHAAPELTSPLRTPHARMLPEHLRSFDQFRLAFWRDERGEVAPAPWTQEKFEQSLHEHTEKALRKDQFERLIVFARAAEILEIEGCPDSNDVRALVGMLGGPRTVPAESDVRGQQLQLRLAEGTLHPSLASRLAVFLEAMTSSPSRAVAPPMVQEIVTRTGFSGPMARVLEALFAVGSVDEEPIKSMRQALQNMPTKSPEELSAAVANTEKTLRQEIKTLWSAAGGKVERTHCREAWQKFMTKAQEVFNALLSRSDWDDLRRLDGLLGEYAKIAEKHGAKYTDRHQMDRAAGKLVASARAVVMARREAGRRTRALQGHGLPELVEAYRDLSARLAQAPANDGFTPLLERLVARHEPIADPTLGTFALGEFIKRPALLESLPFLSREEVRGVGVDASAFLDPLSAAAHLMRPGSYLNDVPSSEFSRQLRDVGREDLLAHVRPMSDTDAKFAADALGRALASATRQLSDAQQIAVALHGIAHPAVQMLHSAIEQARQRLNDGPAQEAKPEFLQAWLRHLVEFGNAALAESIPLLRESFDRRAPTPEDRAHFESALVAQRYAEVVALAHGEGDASSIEDRATMWRRAAAGEFADPRRTLRELRARHEDLCRRWLAGIQSTGADDELRSAFVSFVFDTLAKGKNIREPKTRRETSVNMDSVRVAIAKAGLNPSFVPQITAFRDIAVLVPAVSPSNDMFVRSTTELLAKGTDGRITVLLAPAITGVVREQLRAELRKRPHKGVGLIDDLDLVRLLNPGRQQVNPILALLEIVLEQQSHWSQVNPFESQEGQHTKPEMFVGRSEEAEALSQKPLYSRVFSGRRLGKSALLKHIHDSQEKAVLPSGNKLRVVYVPIVGLDHEDAVVTNIIRAFGELGVEAPPPAAPADRLKVLVEAYLRREPKGSVLVFLDEADMFVEAQIKQYEREHERCLAFRMRSEIESTRDVRDLPRVRFVFAGYRATHRLEGAWANWGDVMRLRPLAPNEAARLIAGPLARLGIDASKEAPAIAYRCGYQPAILVRFGQQILEHLDKNLAPARRDNVVVTPEQVAAVYQSPAVQQEIRTIVWNNFQGNPFGQIIFAALLLEFARMPPGAALDDAPSRILQRLRELVPDFMSSNESLDGPAIDRIARTLRDFVDRWLIREVEPATQSYQLRFPHQLNVLLQEDQGAVIRREAAALSGERLDAIEEVRSLVPRVALEDIAYTVTTGGFTAAVVATHWGAAVEQRSADVAARLGYMTNEIIDAMVLAEEDTQWRSRRLALRNVSPEGAARALRAREGLQVERPVFVGGMDLLRWSLRQGRDVELATVPRLTFVQLRWWFERVREISWSGVSPIRTFVEKTFGIPYLVGLLDRQLEAVVGFEGASASEAHIAEAVLKYDRGLDKHARELVSGDAAIGLERREQELLVMISLASDAAVSEPPDQRRALLLEFLASPVEWAELVPGIDRWRGLTSEDRLPLSVLLRSGLLPSDVRANSNDPLERLQVLQPSDPVRSIAKVLERCL